ncbi:2,3-bisphosphoglycerate-independent phosphoglycerate mutase, partial [Candidatus Woesearchaeota archaeon]|nr:2,3-bisphosphoglycerate-independent phosphoglycerate mutase [Candidatus Woesearchaeota archaeon]
MQKRVILIIRDGWGFRKSHYKNAIYHARTPNTDFLMKKYSNSLLNASGEAVGLPKGFQGNSEVGHMTMGAGRIILQSLSRINSAIKDGSFFRNPALLGAISNCKKHNSTLHIMGLVQIEGVHSHLDHLKAILKLCRKLKFNNVLVHVFTDGRDAPVHDSIKHVKTIRAKIATISGRYYAMDRDKRWQRTKKAYDCIVNGKTNITFTNPIKSIKESYKEGITDEFIVPRKLEGYRGIKPHDSVIFFNFRTDRPRQLTQAMIEKKFAGWKRKPLNIYFTAMTEYYKPMNAHVMFRDIKLKNILGEILARKNKRQLRISETEKYAHVTFFFNDQIE